MLNFARNMGVDTHSRMARHHQQDGARPDGGRARQPGRGATEGGGDPEKKNGLLFTFEDVINLVPRAQRGDPRPDPPPNASSSPSRAPSPISATPSSPRWGHPRAAHGRETKLASGEAVAQKDVVEARRMVTDLALEMAGRGEIELNPDPDEGAYIR